MKRFICWFLGRHKHPVKVDWHEGKFRHSYCYATCSYCGYNFRPGG